MVWIFKKIFCSLNGQPLVNTLLANFSKFKYLKMICYTEIDLIAYHIKFNIKNTQTASDL